MSEVFISYARSTETVAQRIAEKLRSLGHDVWSDEKLPAHRAYADEIEDRLRAAAVVVVVWSADATQSQWVRAEADLARNAGKLVQLRIDGCKLPLPFDQIQCLNLSSWSGDSSAQSWRMVETSIAALLSKKPTAPRDPAPDSVVPTARETLLAVLAFDNLSNDEELSYFSDGVSEEILFTVARAQGMRVIGKASSFQFRGQDKTAQKVAEGLGATHMLDGSVRRAGDNIRISAELVDTASLETLWSDRYDRALTDIFALQDDIAAAIAAALDHHFARDLAPMTVDPAAYDLYLQALAVFAQDLTWADQKKCMKLLEEAVALSPNFAPAWGRLAVYRQGHAGIVAAQRALRLDPNCGTAQVALAMAKPAFAEHTEKLELCERAYLLSPDDQLVAGAYNLVLISLGLLSRSCELSDARFERDPLSPMVAGGLALAYRYIGRNAEAIALADRVIRDFQDAEYVKFIRAVIAIYDNDIDCAEEMAKASATEGNVSPLQGLVVFVRALVAMDQEARAATVRQFLHRNAPKSFFVDIGLAAAMGETDTAMEHLLDAIREGRPLEFSPENDGRAATEATVTVGLFMPNCEVLRRDPRFAEVCVRLGLYDCWRDTGFWPDCVAELAPLYDLKAECAALADTVDRYVARPTG